MRFEVPQFIEIEDKIFGPFTWQQFVYVVGGAGAVFMLYALLPFYIFIVLAVPVGGLAASLAFFRVNNRPFVNLLESVFSYLTGARLYLWQKVAKRPIATKEGEKQTYLPPASSTISSLSRKLEINALQKK